MKIVRFPQLKSRFEPGTAKKLSSLPIAIDHMKRIDDIIREFVDYKLMFASFIQFCIMSLEKLRHSLFVQMKCIHYCDTPDMD